MYTITTIYRCPTNRRGARIEAHMNDGAPSKLTVPYRHELSAAANHEEAALRMANHCGCGEPLVGGPDRGEGIWYWVPVIDAVTRTVVPGAGTCAWPPAGVGTT